MRSVARVSQRTFSIVLWGLVVLVIAALVAPDETVGQAPHRAALIIDFGGEGNVSTACVSFPEDEISGADLLRRSGMSVVFSGFGGLGSGVCQIDGEGCDNPGNCFCECTGANCRYWSYWVLENGAWRYQHVGASARDVVNGEVHAWIWNNGRTPPDPASFGGVCPLELPATAIPTRRPPDPNPQPGIDEPTAVPIAPAPGATATSASNSVPRATARPTALAHAVAATPAGGGAPGNDAALPPEGDTASVPAGLIAFGAVSGALVLAIGGLILRRRLRG